MARRFSVALDCFILLCAFSVGAQNSDFTGTWNGKINGTKHCRNGLTVHESDIPITAELIHVGSTVSGAVSVIAPQYDEQCTVTGSAPIVIPISGIVAGATLTVPFDLDAQTAGGEVSLTVSGSSMTFSVSIPDEGVTDDGMLARTDSQSPSGVLSGSYNGNFTNTIVPCHKLAPITYSGVLAVTLLQAGGVVTGCFAVTGGLTDHEDGSGQCTLKVEPPQPAVGSLVGQTDGTKMVMTITDRNGITHQATATASGNTMHGEFSGEDVGESVVFSVMRTSSGFPAACITRFTAARSTTVAGAWTLSWTSMNAVVVSIDNGIGIVAIIGSATVSPKKSTAYTLTATGLGGTAFATVTATVGIPRRRSAHH
jgi:hypothetical protein